MWEGSYGDEPFDLRLLLLRMLRNLGVLLGVTLAGTLLFGGGYYVKNVLFGAPALYERTVTCKMEYTNPPVQSGDYYINEMTWNTYVDSDEFRCMLENASAFAPLDVRVDLRVWPVHSGGYEGMVTAAVASDIHVPSFTVSTPYEDSTNLLTAALVEVLEEEFPKTNAEVASIRVMDVSPVQEEYPDVRPLRAVILSAILSGFFVTVLILLRELGADSIWLPVTLRRRYGLKALGTIESAELEENIKYLFADCKEIAVCGAGEKADPEKVIGSLKEKLSGSAVGEGCLWLAVPAPVFRPEAAKTLRDAESVLLVVHAGLHEGRVLERVLEYFAEQDIAVRAALLWDADERLIQAYYGLPGGRK